MLSDLRESGKIEQAASAVMLVYRDECYNPDDTDQPGIAEIIVAKNKDGATGTAQLSFKKECTRFETVTLRTMNTDGEIL